MIEGTSLQHAQTKDAPAGAYGGILLCSLAVLMLEVLLTRVFSFTIWYHLAYLTISTALLGFGAAGSLLAAFPNLLKQRVRRLMAVCSGWAALATLVSVGTLSQFPLDPSQLLTDRTQFFLGLLGYYVAVTIPFLLAGIAISAPLAVYTLQVNRLYGADLFGAGLGCLAAVYALTWMEAQGALCLCAAVFAAAGACYAAGGSLRVRLMLLSVVLAAASPWAHNMLAFRITDSKDLGGARLKGTDELFHQWTPINRVDLHIDEPARVFWMSTGLNHDYRGPQPGGAMLQYDGHNGTNVLRVSSPNLDGLRFLDVHLLRTPYVLFEQPEVMIIGVGGGVDVLNALRRGASRVVGVELQPITVALHQGELYTEGGGLKAMTGGQFQRPEVELYAAEGRHFVRSHHDQYDIVQITMVDTFSAQTTGAYVLAESYLYTVEAFEDYFEHLNDDGVISIALGDLLYRDPSLPSPLGTRLVMGAREALERRGVTDPALHIAMIAQPNIDESISADFPIAGGYVQALLIKKSPFTADEISRLESFANSNGFEVRLAPGQSDGTDAPVFQLLHEPAESLGQALDQQPFQLEAVVDDRPFFYHATRWSSIFGGSATLWYLPGSTVGLMMLAMMLGQAILFGIVLIGFPLLRTGRGSLSWGQTTGFFLYFLGLGLGFLLIEISFVQKYVLLLGYPTYSLSVTIFSLLVFAGLGAALSRLGWGRPRGLLTALLVLTIGLVLVEIFALPAIRERLLAAPLSTRILVTVLFQFPLGTCLGMYFPTGVELLRRREPALIPWAWAINGIASVASSVLAVILGMSIGFSAVAVVAAGIYAVGTVALLIVIREPTPAGEASTS